MNTTFLLPMSILNRSADASASKSRSAVSSPLNVTVSACKPASARQCSTAVVLPACLGPYTTMTLPAIILSDRNAEISRLMNIFPPYWRVVYHILSRSAIPNYYIFLGLQSKILTDIIPLNVVCPRYHLLSSQAAAQNHSLQTPLLHKIIANPLSRRGLSPLAF